PAIPSPSSTLRQHHSFPTRRSSDLDRPRGGFRSLLWRQKLVEEEPAQRLRRARVAREEGALHDLRQADEREDGAIEIREVRREGDRKSTRLNSSHVSISYAVFCLQK